MEIPTALLTDFWDGLFDDGALRLGEVDRVAPHAVLFFVFAVLVAAEHGFAGLVVLSVNGDGVAAVES